MSTPIILDSMVRVPEVTLDEPEWRKIKRRLTLTTPQVEGFAGFEGGRTVEAWRFQGDKIVLPRNWGRSREFLRHYEFEDRRTLGAPVDLSFKGEFRTGQRDYVHRIVDGLRHDGLGGVGMAACGFGKTVTALAILAELDTTSLVLVHKEFLMAQWDASAKHFLGTNVGFVQGERCEYQGKKIVVAMVQSLARRRYPAEFYKHFGLVIADEVHHMAAPMFLAAIQSFPSRWRLGLTATPGRADRLEDVFFWNIGGILAEGKGRFLDCSVYRIKWNPGIPRGSYMFGNKCSLARLINKICADSSRTAMLCRTIAKAARAGRKVLVLTDRVAHRDDMTERLNVMFAKEKIYASSYAGGQTKKAKTARDEAARAPVIVSTWPMAKEGLDLPELDTLVMASPKSEVEQAVGRIRRTGVKKKEPMVVEVVDAVPELYGLARKRLNFYTRSDDTKSSWVVRTLG